jgi:hypothetical protein
MAMRSAATTDAWIMHLEFEHGVDYVAIGSGARLVLAARSGARSRRRD